MLTQVEVYGGVAILSNNKPEKSDNKLYYQHEANTPDYKHEGTFDRVLMCNQVTYHNEPFTIATTHFTWTPDGQPSNNQRQDINKLMSFLDTLGEFVLCGDFNAPRGGEIFAKLSNHYQDNIPLNVTTTIDPNIHYSGGLDLVVDGLFTTPRYTAYDVQVIGGISDHKAIVSNIKVTN